jgi:predicted phage terminase large subunit-like protein
MTLQNLIEQAKNYLHNAQDKQDINYKVSQWLTSDLLNKTILSLQEKGLSQNAILVKINQQMKIFKAKKAKDNFSNFVDFLGKHLEPNWIFNGKQQILIKDAVQAFLKQKQKLLLIEASKRSGKTELGTIFTMLWIAGNYPNKKMLVATGNKRLKLDIIKKFLRGIESEAYQNMFNQPRIIINNQETIMLSNGFSIAFLTTNSDVPTGTGYHFMIFEDYLTITAYRSLTERENALSKFHDFCGRTQADPDTQIIVNNQRLGYNDLSEYITTLYDSEQLDYLRVTIPYYFENSRVYNLFAQNNTITFNEGEFCVPWFNQKTMQQTIVDVGGRADFEAQCQQNPTQANEQIISIKDHHYYNSQDISQFNFNHIIISVDAASSDNVGSDYTAMLCFGIRDKAHYLLELMRVKCVYDDMERQFAQFYAMCQNDYQTPTFVIVEDKSNGSALLSRLCSYRVINPNTQQPINACFYAMKPISNKVERLREVSGHINNDYFKIPIDRKGVADYVFELEQFPNAKNDDYVDATSQYIKKMHEILYGA